MQCDSAHYLDIDPPRAPIFWRPFRLTLRQPPAACGSETRKKGSLPILWSSTARAIRYCRMTSRQQRVRCPKRGSAYLRIRDRAKTSRQSLRRIIRRRHPLTSSDESIPFLLLGRREVLGDRPRSNRFKMCQGPRRDVFEDHQKGCCRQCAPE